jgi:mycothiol system anti-sigma-R factor
VDLSPTECERVLEQIELYLDGELGGSVRLEVERHLGACGGCTGHADFQRRLKEMVRDKCGCHEVPAELVERVRSLLERTQHLPP